MTCIKPLHVSTQKCHPHGSFWNSKHKTSRLIHKLIAPTVSIKILGYYYYRIHNVKKYKSTLQWHYTTLHYPTLHYTTLHYPTIQYNTPHRTTRYTAEVVTGCDLCGSYTSIHILVYTHIVRIIYKQLRACIWSGLLCYDFGVTTFRIFICQPGVFQNFNILIYWW